jgi:predicted metal-binding membrane protein
MMGAMMLPSAAPMILTLAAAQARRDRNVAVPTWMFVSHLRHQRAIFAVMHNGALPQRCGNVRP